MKMDIRLTSFDWAARQAAPVSRLMDPHVHYDGDPKILETLAKTMDRYHVECAFVISQRQPGADWLKQVDALLPIGKKAIPFYRVDMVEGSPDDVQRAFDAGYWGIKMISPNRAYDDRFYDPMFARMEALNMPALFHVGLLGKGEYERSIGCGMSLMRADMLDTIASRFPKLLIQGAHLGSPNITEALLTTTYSPNLIWDACGGCRHILRVNPTLLAAALEGRASLWSRIMWSTDTTSGVFPAQWADGWPSQYEYQLAIWQDILSRLPTPPTTAQLDGFFYDNAASWLARIRANRG